MLNIQIIYRMFKRGKNEFEEKFWEKFTKISKI